MLPYTVYSEAGGVGKTTLTAALADAHADHGRDVLAIDLDPQMGSLTYLVGVDVEREAPGNTLSRHLINKPQGDFEGIVDETSAGFDLIPNHAEYEKMDSWLTSAAENDLVETRIDALRQTLIKHNIPDHYDTIVIDPPATASIHLSLALAATRSLLVPAEPTAKGMQGVESLSSMTANLETMLTEELDTEMSVGVLAVIPNGIGRTSSQERYQDRINDLGYPAPVALRQRQSMFEGAWDEQCTPQEFVDEHRDRKRDHELETLAKIDELATALEEADNA
jgi:chromosome partitioning protein